MSNKVPSLRGDISRVRHLGSARSGTEHAWAIRVTSAALVPLTLLFCWLVISLVGKDLDSVRQLFGHSIWPSAVAILFVLTGIHHMKLGMQTIIEDYVHEERLKQASIMGNIFFCGLIAVATALAIVKLSLSA